MEELEVGIRLREACERLTFLDEYIQITTPKMWRTPTALARPRGKN